MNNLEQRVAHDLRQIADRAAPSPDAWTSILTRIANQEPDTETEIIMLTEATPQSTRRWLLIASAAAAALAIIGATVIAFAVNDASDDNEHPAPAVTVPPATTVVPSTIATTQPTAVDDHGVLEGRWSTGPVAIDQVKSAMLRAGVTQELVDDWVLNAGSPTEYTFTLEFHGDSFNHSTLNSQLARQSDDSGTFVYDRDRSRLTLSLVDQGGTYEFNAPVSCCDQLTLRRIDATDDLDAIAFYTSAPFRRFP